MEISENTNNQQQTEITEQPIVKRGRGRPKKNDGEKIKPQSFKERYTNPEYKAKHLAYINTPVLCELCNITSSRVKFVQHCRSRRHLINEMKQMDNYDEVKKILDTI